MPVVTLTAFFRDDDGHGWSETHQVDGGVTITSLATILTPFDDLMKKFRVPLLASDGFYIGCRASYTTANKQRAGSNLLAPLPIKGPGDVDDQDRQMNLASDAVKVTMKNAADTARSDIYLRGVPDAVISAGQLFLAGAVGTPWNRALKAYASALKGAAYGWVGVNPATTSRGTTNDAVQQVDGTVLFTVLQTNGIPLPVTLDPIPIKFAKINRSKSILNRLIMCTVVDATHVKSVQQISFNSFDTAGVYSALVKGFIPYDHYGYVKAASRKTGKPFGVGRGRLPAQVLH